ncbi:alpha/beta fold hydrolase [Aliiglaciecola litoralis]|uniref:AB hydrolase-1 domain-containing protein n=1 Tax=Aliiglaciecola litoralis TaxID=582857 RepID=A0ABN1LIJ4_9ALTE
MNEEALLVGPTKSLAAIYSAGLVTEGKDPKTAVLLLNSGLIHHAGPARLYTRLARCLASKGKHTIRFDLSGIGDSIARPDNLSIYQIATQEPKEVMDYLQRRGFTQFILAGICSGAYCAFKAALVDHRVIATVLINYQDDTVNNQLTEQAWSQRYWRNSLFRLDAWRNLVTGNVNYQRLFSTLGKSVKSVVMKTADPQNSESDKNNAQSASFADEMERLLEREVRVLMLISGLDISQEFLRVLMGDKLNHFQQHPMVEVCVIDGADHLFTNLSHQQQFIDIVESWITPIQ